MSGPSLKPTFARVGAVARRAFGRDFYKKGGSVSSMCMLDGSIRVNVVRDDAAAVSVAGRTSREACAMAIAALDARGPK